MASCSGLTPKLSRDTACTANRTRTANGSGGVGCSALLGRLAVMAGLTAPQDPGKVHFFALAEMLEPIHLRLKRGRKHQSLIANWP